MEVGAWLRGLGLERYEKAFRDNDIDTEVLPELTGDDLLGLGIASIGHRRKLLAAIAALRAGLTSSAPTSPPAEANPGAPLAARSREAERRQLTVMFVDLVGSTELSRRLDPEDMRGVIHAYQNTAAGEILRFGGHVAKFMGDGILAYFGWPRAHEDAAERAVRAGLAVVQALGGVATPAGESLAARVGIATGLVVVGDLVGEGAAQEEAVVGDTPNLAARLQQAAEPSTVAIAETTRRLVGGLFIVDPLPGTVLRGFGNAARAFRVLGESAAESRFEAMHGAAPGLMVGRDEELALLLERWRLARAGEGQVVLLSGEPGIGKSRIVLALRERLRTEDRIRVSYACSPYHENSVLWPVVQQLERAARFSRDDGPAERLAKLRALLAEAVEPTEEMVALLAELLGLSGGGGLPSPALTPQQRKARTLDALITQLEGLARRRPVLLILEDTHWLDPFHDARDDLEAAATQLEQSGGLAHATSLGVSVGVFNRAYDAHCDWHLGHVERALDEARQSIELARHLAHPFSLAVALTYGAMLAQFRREPNQVRELAEAALVLTRKHDFSYYRGWAEILAGWASAEGGDVADCALRVQRGLAGIHATGAELRRPYYLGLLAELHLRAGHLSAAADALRDAFAVAERNEESWNDVNLWLLKGDSGLALAMDTREAARACYERAVGIAEAQGAVSLVLRSRLRLARLRLERADRDEAREQLAQAVARFDREVTTPELEEARAATAELAG